MLVITILLVLFFLFASSVKILGWQKFIFETQLVFFKKYGLSRNHMFVVGLIEFIASLLLVISLLINRDDVQALGALGVALTSVGAIYFHLKFDTLKDAIPAIITLTLSSILLIYNSFITALFSL